MVGYTVKTDSAKTARALGKELPISPKKAREVCQALKGREVGDALEYLEGVVALEKPVPYKRYNKCVAHQKNCGPGGFPVKVAKAVIRIIEDAQANAEYKGIDTEKLVIHTISAHKGRPNKMFRPRAHGRSTPFYQDHTHIEVILSAEEEE